MQQQKKERARKSKGKRKAVRNKRTEMVRAKKSRGKIRRVGTITIPLSQKLGSRLKMIRLPSLSRSSKIVHL